MTRQGTYLDHMLGTLAAGGEQAALVGAGQLISGSEAAQTVLRLANALAGAGVKTGDGVAFCTAINRPDAVLLQLAVHLIGGRLIFVPPEPGMGELIGYTRQAEPTVLIFEPGVSELMAELTGQVPLARLFSLGPAKAQPGGPVTDLLELAAAAPAEPLASAAEPADVVTVFYTGGTTGRPKLVTHRHGYYELMVRAAARRRADSDGPLRVLICTLTSHTSGHVGALTFLLAGGTVLVAGDDFDAGTVLGLMERERVTGLVLTPPMLYELLDHPGWPESGFPALTRIHYSGAPAAPARLHQAIERFGPVLRQTYGLTEVPVIAILEPGQHDLARPQTLRSCGQPLPFVQVELRDGDGEPVSDGQVGEVCVRGAGVLTEYWADPALTERVLAGGWLRTGDLGRRDEDGYLYLVDRAKDVIITGRLSDNVYSRLLDDLAATLPGVRHAAAVGVPDERHGEAIHLFVVPQPGARPDPDELTEQVVAGLGESYRPRYVSFVEALPWTSMGKIDKRALRAAACAQPAAARR